MVKSKSAGYICQTIKPSKVHRFSLVDNNEDESDSLEREEMLLKSLLPQTNVNTG